MEAHNFRNLKVWQLPVDFVEVVYRLSPQFPDDEKYGLLSQLKRCAVSIPSNIAEGSGRTSDKDFHRFLSTSLSSCFELETQLILSNRSGFLSGNVLNELIVKLTEIQKMLYALQRKLNRNDQPPHTRLFQFLFSFF